MSLLLTLPLNGRSMPLRTSTEGMVEQQRQETLFQLFIEFLKKRRHFEPFVKIIKSRPDRVCTLYFSEGFEFVLSTINLTIVQS
jgi:hypothetical protein